MIEIGVRVALGARPLDVRWLVILGSAAPILAGIVSGSATALGLGRFISGLLYGVGPGDPLTFSLVAVGLVGVGGLSSYVPARRATRVLPLEALRE